MPEDRDDSFTWEGGATRGVTDALRRVLLGSVGTLLTTEEGIRAAVRELKLPKELMQMVLAQAQTTRTEVVAVLAREMRGFLASMDAQALMQRALSGLVLEITAEVRFKLDEEGDLVPQVKVNSKPRSKTRAPSSSAGKRRKPREA